VNKKTKLFALFFTLIAFIAVSSATTIYTNRDDALADLGKLIPVEFTAGECRFESATQTFSLEGEEAIKVRYIFDYILDGKEEEFHEIIEVENETEIVVKNAIAKRCDEKKIEFTEEAQNKRITKVYVDYAKGDLASLLNESYNVLTKTWGNIE